MDDLILLTECEDGQCCCLSPRSSVALISLIGQVGCLMDFLSSDGKEYARLSPVSVESFRNLLLTFFQMANMLLLLGTIVECYWLLKIYVWYTLAFIVLGFVVSILGFLYRYRSEGARSLVSFVPEVVFLFVIFRCLPIVDEYRKRIDNS